MVDNIVKKLYICYMTDRQFGQDEACSDCIYSLCSLNIYTDGMSATHYIAAGW